MKLFGIYGASGCGRGILPIARSNIKPHDRLVFIDDALSGEVINGHTVMNLSDFQSQDYSERKITVAIADPVLRKKIVDVCEQQNIEFFSVSAPSVITMDDVTIGEGALLSPYVVITSNVTIGRHFHCNIHSYVEHDCSIGDFVTFAPGVRCNGNIEIGNFAYIGSGAIIKQGSPGRPLKIGSNSVIGMGAIVTRDVPENTVVAGNPARIL